MKTNVFKILILSAAWLALVVRGRAERPTIESLLSQAQTKIEEASHDGAEGSLDDANLAIDRALVLENNNPWAWYFKGRAAYVQSSLRGARQDSVGQEAALNDADKSLEKSISIKRSGEALALHSTVLGGLIVARGGEAAMQLGPRLNQELSEAQRLSPKSPRVLMFAGISKLFTPPQWGGDVGEAKKLLEGAVAETSQDTPPAPEPSWGKADAHVWLGLTLQRLGKYAEAKAEFERALEIEPKYNWVRMVLLPNSDHPAKL